MRRSRILPSSVFLWLLALVLLLVTPRSISAGETPCCGGVTSAGRRLAATLDGMRVESLWLANEHVNWETGEPDRGGDYEGPGKHTHCSAFAASAAKRLGVYLLRPPDHGQQLLANAQAEWLRGDDARSRGWRRITGEREAQREANRGNLVVVVFANPDKHEPGHVAIVRPAEKSLEELRRDGPQIIQAGQHNHTNTVVRVGFANHPGAFPHGVRYYAHDLDRHGDQ